MIWGITIEPGQLLPVSIVDEEVHLSMAALKFSPELTEGRPKLAEVFIHSKDDVYLLCTLVHGVIYQQSLDFILSPQEQLSFSISGHGSVYLTGYTRLQSYAYEEEPSTFQSSQSNQDLDISLGDDGQPFARDDPLMSDRSLQVSQITPWVEKTEDVVQITCAVDEGIDVVIREKEENLKTEDVSQDCHATSANQEVYQIDSGVYSTRADAVKSDHIAMETRSDEEDIMGEEHNPHQQQTETILNGVAVYQTEPQNYNSNQDTVLDNSYEMSDHQGKAPTNIQFENEEKVDQTPNSSSRGDISKAETSTKERAPPINSSPLVSFHTPAHDGRFQNQDHRTWTRTVSDQRNQKPSKIQILPANLKQQWTRDNLPATNNSVVSIRNDTTYHHANRSSMTSRGNVTCAQCNTSFTCQSSLDSHDCPALSGDLSFRCRFCTETFPDFQTCDEHERFRHLGVRCFKCRYCDKYFKTKPACEVHERIHTGVRPYQCKFCKKSFTQFGSCKIHERIHTGSKPFQCRFCPKTFNVRGNCTTHERIHTGQRPFACQFCSKTFAVKSNCKTHERTHLFKEMHIPIVYT